MFDGLPLGHFHVIVADPGTRFNARSRRGERYTPQNLYTTMTDAEIAALPVGDYGAKHSFLFLWETTPRLALGLHVPIMRAWGYEPSAIAFTWVKLRGSENAPAPWFYPRGGVHVGRGFTTRKNTEVCILGRRGSPRRRSLRVFELIFAPRREHSRKPDEFYARVQEYAAGPYLELFSRERRHGWTCCGDQVDKFSALPNHVAAE